MQKITDRPRIMVIDDDEGILEGFVAVLESHDYQVLTAPNADSLNKLPKDSLPDLILLDVLLSGQDGRDVCKILKSHALTKSIPIIMISAHPKVEKSVRTAGADDFLAKPFEIDMLLQKITHILDN